MAKQTVIKHKSQSAARCGRSAQAGMTYIELIVVLGIFSVLSSVAMFNYSGFQDQVEIKNLGSDVGLKVFKAQNDSRAGAWTPLAPVGWKPSYGMYFEADSANDKNFIYFADYNNNGFFDNSGVTMDCSVECLEKISITKGNRITDLSLTAGFSEESVPDVTIVFSRTNAEPVISSQGILVPNAEIKITAESPKGLSASVTVSPSGKMDVK